MPVDQRLTQRELQDRLQDRMEEFVQLVQRSVQLAVEAQGIKPGNYNKVELNLNELRKHVKEIKLTEEEVELFLFYGPYGWK